jgi:hypothetical protein
MCTLPMLRHALSALCLKEVESGDSVQLTLPRKTGFVTSQVIARS